MSRLIVFFLLYSIQTAVIAIEPVNNQQAQQKPAIKQFQELTREEQAWLTDHNSVRIAYDGNLPPYSFINDAGKVDGIAVEIMTLLSKRLGINFKIFPESKWDSIYKAAASRKVDVVATMVNRPERSDWFSFTKPYLTKSLVIVTKQDNNLIKSRDDLDNKKIAVVSGYQYGEQIGNEFPNAKRIKTPSMLDSLISVIEGKSDAAILFLGSANYLQAKHKLTNLRIAGFYDRNSANESIAVRKDWPLLVTILQKGLDSISEEEVQQIFAKWVVGRIPQLSEETDKESSQIIAPIVPKTVVEIEQKPIHSETDKDHVIRHITEDDVKILNLVILMLVVIAGFFVWLILVRKQKKIRAKPKNEMLTSVRNLQSIHNDVMHMTIDRPDEINDDAKLEAYAPEIITNIQENEKVEIHYQLDCEGRFNYVSPSVTSVLGYSEEEFVSHFRDFLTDNPVNRNIDVYLDACIQGKPSTPYEIEIYDAGQCIRWLEVTISPVYNGQGHCIGVEGLMRDITGQKLTESQHQILPDTLPKTEGKGEIVSAISEKLKSAIAEADRFSRTFALMYISLDRMRAMDGSATIDPVPEVWMEAGKRLRSVLRDTDTVVELQVDKFALIMPETGADTAALVVDKIRKILQIPYLAGVQSIVMDVKLGIAIYPANGGNPDELMASAMVLSEHTGPTEEEPAITKAELISEADNDGDNLELMQELVLALDECKLALRSSNVNNINALRRHSQLSIHYHSIHSLQDLKIAGFEALIRWQHPQQGVLEPIDFVPLVRDIGLLDVMTYWIIQNVSLQAVVWDAQGIRPEKIIINLSDVLGNQSYDVDKISTIIKEAGAKPEWLVFSIDEKEFADKSYFVLPMVEKIVATGASVSIDNFGTESSVLNLLKTIPAMFVELDPSFIRQLPQNSNDAEMIRHTIAMLHEMGKKVIAKAVNKEEQMEFLKRSGCDMIQGHLLSRAIPAEEAKELMKNLPNLSWYFEQA